MAQQSRNETTPMNSTNYRSLGTRQCDNAILQRTETSGCTRRREIRWHSRPVRVRRQSFPTNTINHISIGTD